MTVRVGINGFGRIGRNFFRAAKESGADIDFVAANDLGALDQMAHLLKYDSVLGTMPQKISATKSGIRVGNDSLRILSERNPSDLPWGELGVDIVIESTGFFNNREAAAGHLDAGAPLVRVSAPCSGADATSTPWTSAVGKVCAQGTVLWPIVQPQSRMRFGSKSGKRRRT